MSARPPADARERAPVDMLDRLLADGFTMKEIARGTGIGRSSLQGWRKAGRVPRKRAETVLTLLQSFERSARGGAPRVNVLPPRRAAGPVEAEHDEGGPDETHVRARKLEAEARLAELRATREAMTQLTEMGQLIAVRDFEGLAAALGSELRGCFERLRRRVGTRCPPAMRDVDEEWEALKPVVKRLLSRLDPAP